MRVWPFNSFICIYSRSLQKLISLLHFFAERDYLISYYISSILFIIVMRMKLICLIIPVKLDLSVTFGRIVTLSFSSLDWWPSKIVSISVVPYLTLEYHPWVFWKPRFIISREIFILKILEFLMSVAKKISNIYGREMKSRFISLLIICQLLFLVTVFEIS